MKKAMNRKYISILLLFLLSLNVFSQEKKTLKDHSVLKSKLIKQAKETSSIIASFTQEKHLSFMNTPQVSEGIFYYQQADKMRWEQNTPFNYVLLINKGNVRIKDNGKEKDIVGANKMMGKINTLMLGLINGDIFNNKEFTTQYFTYLDFYIIELTPKNKRLKSIFNSIELTFSKNTTRLKILTFNEKGGDKSVMKFLNEKFNEPIKESIFNKL
jgi:outer membrane lipoprotein-sorting protein